MKLELRSHEVMKLETLKLEVRSHEVRTKKS